MSKRRILIAGGGIGGLSAAILLAQGGSHVDIFEQSPEWADVGAGIQQSPNALHVHAAMGTLSELEAAAYQAEFATLRDYKTGHALLVTEFGADFKRRYGQGYLSVHRADLHSILQNAAIKAGAHIHSGMSVTGYHQAEAKVSLYAVDSVGADKTFDGDILIGADGIKSSVRDTMLGPRTARFTGHVAWRGLVPLENLPGGCLPEGINNWLGPQHHFVAYPVRGGSLINFVAIKEQDVWVEEGWSLPGNIDVLRDSFQDWDSPVTTLLAACETTYLWGLFDHPALPRWTDRRIALLGDAAHPMLPFMAQGASAAIEDAWVLARSLAAEPNIALALKTYESARRPRAAQLQKRSKDNAALYHQSGGAGKALRTLKFGLAKRLPAIAHSQLDPVFGENVVSGFPMP